MLGAVVQARMGSSRLPGKVLKKVAGRPLVDYLYTRLKECKPVDHIIFAITDQEKDDVLAEYLVSQNYAVFRGSENDVLERYFLAAQHFNLDHVMRITADCPLIDPVICAHLIEIYYKEHADYAFLSPQYAEGLDAEVMSFDTLEKAYHKATLLSEREHVTQYIHNHRNLFKRIEVPNSCDDGHYRITVDEEEDFDVVKTIINHFEDQDVFPNFAMIKQFLDDHPDVMRRNAHIIRNEGLLKSLANDKAVE